LSADNLARSAIVKVSSVYSGYSAAAAIDGMVDGYPGDVSKEWASNGEGVGATIRLTWAGAQNIDRIWLFDRPNSLDHITSGQLTFSSGAAVNVGELTDNAASGKLVSFTARLVTWVQFEVTGVRAAENIGLAEFAAIRTGADLGIPEMDVRDDVLEDWTTQKFLMMTTYSTGINPRPGWWSEEEYRKQIYNLEALIKASDRDEADVVVRRIEALLKDIGPGLSEAVRTGFEAQLAVLKTRNANTAISDNAGRNALYFDACLLRRAVAFANPLLDFSELLFVKHQQKRNHLVKETGAHGSFEGGGVFILKNAFSDNPQLVDLLQNAVVANGRMQGQKLAPGSFKGPELSYDGRTIYFSYSQQLDNTGQVNPNGDKWVNFRNGNKTHYQGNTFGIYKINVDGTGLFSVLDRPWEDQAPAELPDGRLVFMSDSRMAAGRCNVENFVPGSNLFSMKADGSDLFPISFHETNEWEPSVDNNGMIVYQRWDYVDRTPWVNHNIWLCYPDGRDPRAFGQNFPHYEPCDAANPLAGCSPGERVMGRRLQPSAEKYIRAIPGSHKYAAVAMGHDAGTFGQLIIIDLRVPDDGMMSQVKRLSADGVFPETEAGQQNSITPHPQSSYGPVWPLNEKYHLVTFWYTDPSVGQGDIPNYGHGIYLLDCFGNKELIYRDPNFSSQDPIPLKPRQRPPVIPTATFQGERDGAPEHKRATISVMNVYTSDFEWPANTVISKLRIVQLLPETQMGQNPDMTGYSNFQPPRIVLGTVPVEGDGSAYFEAPVGKTILFQALDENDMAVMSMRSATYVHPGEHLSCVGCHENKHEAIPPMPNRLAMQRPPSPITPETDGGVEPLNFVRLVQPVLDGKCVSCHGGTQAPDLRGTTDAGTPYWSTSYKNLKNYAFWMGGPRWFIDEQHLERGGSRYYAGKYGARASRLMQYLKPDHYDVNLTDTELRRLTLWLDNLSPFHGTYDGLARQAAGELVWPFATDVDPDNPIGVEIDRPVPSEPPAAVHGVSEVVMRKDNIRLFVNSEGFRLPDYTGDVKLLDLSGREIPILNTGNGYFRFTRNVPNGIYFVRSGAQIFKLYVDVR
jgi:hypothetical protein